MNLSCLRNLLILFLLLPQVAHATPLLEMYNYVRFYGASDPRVIYACENSSACTGSTIVPGSNWALQYNAYGTSAFGILKDYASVVMTGDASLGGFPSFVSVGSRSGYRDTYTISGSRGTGIAKFTFTVTGTTSSSDGAGAGPLFQYIPVTNGQEQWSQQLNFGVDSNGSATVEVPFTFGQSFEGVIYLYALAQVYRFDQPTFAEADFSHTAILSSIAVFDTSGMPVNFALDTESGAAYPLASRMPEPSTPWLAGVASGAFGLVRRFSRASAGARRRA